jgi:hypothetical protein
MPELMEHTLRADIVQTDIVRSECLILVDPNGNPVIEFRGGRDNTLQVIDKYGNIKTEIKLG